MADTKHNTAGILGKYAWLTTAGRVAYLLLLAALTLGLLTAAQISSAFLKASGSEKGVSAVAIRSAAEVYLQNRDEYASGIVGGRANREASAKSLALIGNAGVYEYVHKVAFRRYAMGCFPKQYKKYLESKAAQTGQEDTLSWNAVMALYTTIKDNPEPQANLKECSFNAPRGTEFVGHLELNDSAKDLFADCNESKFDPGLPKLECLWTNVATATGLGSASEKYRNALSAASDARLGGLRGLDGELTASSNLASPEARSAVAAWLELSRPAWENDADRQDRYCKAMERQGYGSGKGVRQSAEYTASCLKPQENVARDAGLLDRICAFLACIGTLPGNLVAALVIVPLLAQTAAMAMAAGALGGGIARLWEEYGNGPTANAVLETISARLSEISVVLNGQARNDPAGSGLQDELRAVHAHLDRLQAGEGMGVATFLGAVSALMIWLLATGGLFVLSGGEEASAASPNVLLALSLVAGLARGNVIELAFSIADQTFKPERQEELRKAREKSNAETSKAVAEAEAATAEADKVKAEAAKARADAEAAEAAAKKAAEGGGSDQGGGAR